MRLSLIVICSGGNGTSTQPTRACPPTELVRNGGFEEGGQFTTLRDWEEELDEDVALEHDENTAYEGTFAAEFRSLASVAVETKLGLIKQRVTVMPGCFLILSFADNFQEAGVDFDDLDVAARVYYTDAGGNPVNLINVEIDYSDDQAGNGYIFHQRVSDGPVPLNVSSVTVEFEVEFEDTSGTTWLLDGVSLRQL